MPRRRVDRDRLEAALRAVIEVSAPHLDAPALTELREIMPRARADRMSDLDEARARRAIGTIIDGSAPRDTIPTGSPSLDNALGGGVRRRDLVVLGGEVGSGKSALTLAIALRASQVGAKVRFLSGEMDQTRAAERALAIEARVRVDDLRRGNLDAESRSRLEVAARRLEQQFPAFDPLLSADIGALEHDRRTTSRTSTW